MQLEYSKPWVCGGVTGVSLGRLRAKAGGRNEYDTLNDGYSRKEHQ